MKTFPAQALIEISAQLPEGEDDDGWMGCLEADGIAAIPNPFRSVLFRGQNRRYRPFLPSIARGLNSNTGKMFEMAIEDQATLVLRLAQSWWFAREVDHHPLTHYAKQENIHLNRLALAQHYEIPTGYLDLTHSFDVAAFFATCRRTSSGWEPIGDSEPEPGIVYRVEFDRMKNALELFRALGPQPLPRPYEQRAWVAELPMVDSFDGWPVVFIMQFEHNESVGRYFLNKFDHGEKLFPPDPLSNVAHEIMASEEIPSELIEGAIESFSQDKFGCVPQDFAALRVAVGNKHPLVPYRRLLTDEKIAPFVDEFERLRQRLSETRMTIPLVRAEPIERHEWEDSSSSTS